MKVYPTASRWHIVEQTDSGRWRAICGGLLRILVVDRMKDVPEQPLQLCRNCARLRRDVK